MAIAFDAAVSGNLVTTGTATLSHTCTGSNRILLVYVYSNNTVKTVTGVTYNGVAMTKLMEGAVTNQYNAVFYLVAPATGANSIIATISASGTNWGICSASYTGVSQVSPINVSANDNTTSQSLTSTVDNCWLTAFFSNAGPPSASGTTVSRSTVQFGGFGCDQNAASSPAGAYSITCSNPGGFVWSLAIMLAPVPVAPTTNNGFFQFMPF